MSISSWVFFLHIDIIFRQESYGTPDYDSETGLPLDIGEHILEQAGSAKKSDGFFEKGVLNALESDHRSGGNVREVKVISNGHCHGKHTAFLGFGS